MAMQKNVTHFSQSIGNNQFNVPLSAEGKAFSGMVHAVLFNRCVVFIAAVLPTLEQALQDSRKDQILMQ